MRAFVGVTDREWYRFLLARPDLDEVNFWQPSGGRAFRAIAPGDPFLFKLHYPENAIVGGGTYVCSTTFPLSITWDAFEEKNGAATRSETGPLIGAESEAHISGRGCRSGRGPPCCRVRVSEGTD